MKIARILSICFGLAFLISGSAYGATIKVPDDYPTIQAAINAAVDGDLILVAPSTYNGTFNFMGKNITVRSDGDGDPATYDILPEATIQKDHIEFNSGETEEAVLDGFTVGDSIGTGYGGSYASPTVKNCIFQSGSCWDGCGVHVWRSSATFVNCTFYGGDAGSDGGALKVGPESSAKFINCTFYGNNAYTGGGLSVNTSSTATLINCIFWGNTASNGNQIAVLNNSTVTISYSNVREGESEVFVDGTSTLNYVTGTNIDANPLFVDAAGKDFHLQSGSPCIDKGTNSAADLPDTDFEGGPRNLDGDNDGTAMVDIGPDEAFISFTGENLGIGLQSGGEMTNCLCVDPANIPDDTNRPEDLIYGLIEMEIEADNPGDNAIVSVSLPNPAPEGYKWYKYSSTGGWIDFSREVISGGVGDGAEFNDDRTQVILYITDIGQYDDDPTVGIIKDPSGLGSSPIPVTTDGDGGGGGGGCFIHTMRM